MTILIITLSSLYYARNRFTNHVQVQIGYYLLVSGISTQVIEVVYQFGISIATKSIRRSMKAVAKIALSNLRTILRDYPRSVIIFDNMDFIARMRDQHEDHQGASLHYCVGLVALNPSHIDKPNLTTNDSQLSRILALCS